MVWGLKMWDHPLYYANTPTMSIPMTATATKFRPAASRGQTKIDWLDSHHSFSFGRYHDPAWPGFRQLRVINEDWVAPAQGFAPHSHQDMEIVSLVLKGELSHRDSIGNGSLIKPGEIQRMSAGSGITHSEYNPSDSQPVHFLQIWIIPQRLGTPPSYEQAPYDLAAGNGAWQLLVGGQDEADATTTTKAADRPKVTVQQDVQLWRTQLQADQHLDYPLRAGRAAWLQVISGELSLELAGGAQQLQAGDGLGVEHVTNLSLTGGGNTGAELLLFDLA